MLVYFALTYPFALCRLSFQCYKLLLGTPRPCNVTAR